MNKIMTFEIFKDYVMKHGNHSFTFEKFLYDTGFLPKNPTITEYIEICFLTNRILGVSIYNIVDIIMKKESKDSMFGFDSRDLRNKFTEMYSKLTNTYNKGPPSNWYTIYYLSHEGKKERIFKRSENKKEKIKMLFGDVDVEPFTLSEAIIDDMIKYYLLKTIGMNERRGILLSEIKKKLKTYKIVKVWSQKNIVKYLEQLKANTYITKEKKGEREIFYITGLGKYKLSIYKDSL